MKLKDDTVVMITLGLGVTALELVAIIKGVDGAVLAVVSSVLVGIVAYYKGKKA